jgi:hypothetical protein
MKETVIPRIPIIALINLSEQGHPIFFLQNQKILSGQKVSIKLTKRGPTLHIVAIIRLSKHFSI